MTEQEIRLLMQNSKQDGYRALFDAYFNYVYTVVFQIIGSYASREDTEECVLDVLHDVMMHYQTGYDGSLKAYIGTTARHKAINLRKSLLSKARHTAFLDEDMLEELPSAQKVEDTVESAEQSRILLEKIEQLGEPDSTIIIQKYFYNKKSHEIAKIVHLSAPAVRMRCKRALKKLKSELSDLL